MSEPSTPLAIPNDLVQMLTALMWMLVVLVVMHAGLTLIGAAPRSIIVETNSISVGAGPPR